jgi:hypothetical protein
VSDANSTVEATALVPLTREGIQTLQVASRRCGVNQAETINNAVQAWAYLQELQGGDVNQALDEGAAVLPSSSGVTSGRALIELRPLRAAAEKAAAEEFCLRYDAAAQALAA